MEEEKIKQDADKAIEAVKQETKDFIVNLIPTALWTAATVFAVVPVFNEGKGFYVACGIIAIIGALVNCVKAFKKRKY